MMRDGGVVLRWAGKVTIGYPDIEKREVVSWNVELI
jgi:hypothetical protein